MEALANNQALVLEERVLVLAPTQQDQDISQSIFDRADIPCEFQSDFASLCHEMSQGVGAAIMTEEALSPPNAEMLKQCLNRQPSWSEIPIILLLQGGADSPQAFRAFDYFGNVFLLDRPARLNTLLSAVKTALRGRERQYQLRAELAERIQAEKALRKSEQALRQASEELEIKVEERTRDLTFKTEELGRSNADLEHFAYVASHDLREPLRMVSSYTQLLLKRLQGHLDSETANFAQFVIEGVKRMNVLIEDLLTYSRAGLGELRLESINLQTLVQQVITDYEERIATGQLVITHDALPTLMAHRSQLLQVFQNLIGNAFKFRSGIPSHIHISARQDQNEWIISVKDNGIGIEADYFERIFVIFQRLHTQTQYPGTGIGLAVCKRIIERHGGKIWLESEPGKGTEFFFSLPSSTN